ncbi:MAG TPA: hypothetical protein VH482_04615 [Thermomicrobiales bacterium]|jgi:hypothetical protein
MNRSFAFARLVALLSALLVVGFPIAAVAQELHPATSPGATPVPADTLDLPAMSLEPSDLDQAGLADLGITYGGFATLDFAARGYAEVRGGDTPKNVDRYSGLLGDAGWQTSHVNYFASPNPDQPGEFTQRLRTAVTQYADADGATRAFDALTDTGEITAYSVEVIPWEGDMPHADQAVLWRYDSTRKATGAPLHALELDLRLGNLTASVTLDDFRGQKPSIAVVESLTADLLRRIETVQASGEPGLSASALRFALPTDTASYDNYARLDEEWTRYYGETPDHLKQRLSIYPDLPDIYVVYQYLGFDESDEAAVITFRSYIYPFDSASAASTWMAKATEGATPVADAPTFGDESFTFACTCDESPGAGQPAPTGFGAVIRVGSKVAVFNLVAPWEISLAAFTDVAQAQTDCLADGGCLQPAPIPSSLVPVTGTDKEVVGRDAESIAGADFSAMIAPAETDR